MIGSHTKKNNNNNPEFRRSSYEGHYWDNQGNMNMNHILNNKMLSLLNFLSEILHCGYET